MQNKCRRTTRESQYFGHTELRTHSTVKYEDNVFHHHGDFSSFYEIYNNTHDKYCVLACDTV
jgi:hypothetical protein